MTDENRGHLAPYNPIAWLNERLVNCRRLAGINHRGDRDGWLEDADHFERAIACIREQQAALRVLIGALNGMTDLDEMDGEEFTVNSNALDEAESLAAAVLTKWSLP